MREKCGIAGIIDLHGEENVAEKARLLALELQHRGELAASISVAHDGVISSHGANGLVKDVLTPELIATLLGSAAIIHARYATSGSNDEELAKPYLYPGNDPRPDIALVLNGNIPVYHQALEKINAKRQDHQMTPIELTRDVDTELLLQLAAAEYRERMDATMNVLDVQQAIVKSWEQHLDGTFNTGMLDKDGNIFAYRHSNAIRPLCYAIIDNRYLVFASESVAIKRLDPKAYIYNVQPGQLVSNLNPPRNQFVRTALEPKQQPISPSHCFFEWIYFSNSNSVLDNESVEKVRHYLGAKLAEENGFDPEGIVVPVPASAAIASQGFARAAQLEEVHGIRRLMDGRTFINAKEGREEKAKAKYEIDPEMMNGKVVYLIEDSIVRGLTMRVLVERLREEGGAKEIHVRIACPPILAPCFYGIDFPTTSELLARKYHGKELKTGHLPEEVLTAIAQDLGVDSIKFVSPDAVKEALSGQAGNLCMACIDGEYPTEEGRKLYALQMA